MFDSNGGGAPAATVEPPEDTESSGSGFRNLRELHRLAKGGILLVLNASLPLQFRYPYEEFADHIKAMRTVREWEYTSRFGPVGTAQTSKANNARVLEYFSDCYADPKEAVQKAEAFLSIYDYIGRHAAFFSKKHLLDRVAGSVFSVDPALLRAVHYAFTASAQPSAADAKRVLALARAFGDFGAG